MRQPSKLRYVECELPSEVEKTIAAFEDSFADSLKPFYDRLADWVANDLPVIEAELESQIALREALLTGAPVKSLSSLADVDKSTNLTSPKRDPNDPDSIRIDERKLGAANLCVLNGRMFKVIPGDRISALRYLWEVAGGDYDYFIRLGTSVYTTPLDSYMLFEYNESTPEKLPFVNKGFSYLTAVGLKNSQFKHRMIWTRGISASYALKSKMVTLGYTSEQINNIFSGYNPDNGYNYAGALEAVNTLIRSVTRLLFLPLADPLRQPLWANEANYIELAITKFLEYRTKKYTTSSTFDPEFWKTFLTELRPKDVKELLENRPEITNLELPQDLDSLTAAVEKAIAAPAETTAINTYMNNLPAGKLTETTLTQTLFDLGLAIWKQMQTTRASSSTTVTLPASQMDPIFPTKHNLSTTPYLSFKIKGATPSEDVTPSTIPFVANSKEILLDQAVLESMGQFLGIKGRSLSDIYGANTTLELSWSIISAPNRRITSKEADRLEQLLLELSGRKTLGDFFNPAVVIDPADISALFPTTNLPPVGALISNLKDDDQKRAIAANSASGQATASEPTPSNIPSGVSQGFPSEETFAMLLSRKLDWGSNFLNCSGSPATPPVTQQMTTVAEYSKTSAVESNAEWAQYNGDIAYLKERITFSSPNISVADIRSNLDSFLTAEEAKGTITRKSTNVSSLLATVNSSDDIKVVVRSAVAIVKMVPTTTPTTSSAPQTYSELTAGADRGAGLYAAKNRNYVEEAGGKVQPPGLTSKEVRTGLEHALGMPIPFMSGGNEVLVPFKANVAVELQVCPNKAIDALSDYGRQLEANRKQFENWILQFVNICKHQIIVFQNGIDSFITAIQQAMDGVLTKLERLLTLDLNFSGKIGFENSLFKCSWGIDLGLKINLLDLLLMYLDRWLGTILKPFTVGLGIIADFIREIMCVPIRWLETILNGAAEGAVSNLLGSIGCTVKDFKLPTAVFEILNLLNATFSIRSLVLRKGAADWRRMMGRLQKGKNEFTNLTQFANACASPDLSSAISALQATTARLISSIPVTSNTGSSGIVALQL